MTDKFCLIVQQRHCLFRQVLKRAYDLTKTIIPSLGFLFTVTYIFYDFVFRGSSLVSSGSPPLSNIEIIVQGEDPGTRLEEGGYT